MKTQNFISGFFLLILTVVVIACSSESNSGSSAVTARAQVQVQTVKMGAIEDSVRLSAQAYFLKRNVVTAPFNAYILEADITPATYIQKGTHLFTIQTKEAKVLNDSGDKTSLGTVKLQAPAAGQVITVAHYAGDYVQEGAVLATIVQPDDVYFKLFVPFQYRNYIQKGKTIPIELPDGKRLQSRVSGSLSQADTPSQTAVYLLKPQGNRLLPEGLQASAYPALRQKADAQVLPKEAVLSNTTLDSFWVMKVAGDSMAVKVPVQKGIETSQQVEILHPDFNATDMIITTGQYGLEDSTLIQVVKQTGTSQ